jgi:hypothetical protein
MMDAVIDEIDGRMIRVGDQWLADFASVAADVREGWRFVRERRWRWVTFVSAAVAYLLFMGPVEVLVPYLVKHDLHATARHLGLVFGAGGLASIITAIVLGRRGIPAAT